LGYRRLPSGRRRVPLARANQAGRVAVWGGAADVPRAYSVGVFGPTDLRSGYLGRNPPNGYRARHKNGLSSDGAVDGLGADPSKWWFRAAGRGASPRPCRTASPRRGRSRLRHRSRCACPRRAAPCPSHDRSPERAGHDVGWSGRHRHGRRGADGDQVMRLVVHAPDVQRRPVSPGSVFRADRLRTRTNWLPRHSVCPPASHRSVSCSTMAVLCQLTSWKRSPLASTCRSKPCDGSRDMAHEGITSRGSAVAALIGLEW